MSKKTMTYLDHLLELRKRIIIVLIFFLLFSLVNYFLYDYFTGFIFKIIGEKLYTFHIADNFLIQIKVSIILGVFFTIPVFIFELTLFLFPALKFKEKIYYLIFLIASLMLFTAGSFFALKSIMPMTIAFLKNNTMNKDFLIRMTDYQGFLDFFFQFLIAFGLSFQFPVVCIILMKFGILKLNFLTKNFKFFIIGIFIFAAILTPPDVISQIFMAIPLIVLYLLTILTAKIFKLGK